MPEDMHSTDKIQAKTEGAIAYLLLNKPAKLNALDDEMLLDIERCFAEWERTPAMAVAVLGSTSERAFCVGADIEVLSRMNEESMQAWELLGNRVLDRIQSSPLVSVACIPGPALGGGLTLAAACDSLACRWCGVAMNTAPISLRATSDSTEVSRARP